MYNYRINFDMTVNNVDVSGCTIFRASAIGTARGGGISSQYSDSKVPELNFRRKGFEFINYAQNPNCGSRGFTFVLPGGADWELNRKYNIEIRLLGTGGLAANGHPTARESRLYILVDGEGGRVDVGNVCTWVDTFLRSQLWMSPPGRCAAPVSIDRFAINYMDKDGNLEDPNL